MSALAGTAQDAMAAGCLALAFVTQPETWPVFAAWVEVHAPDGAPLDGERAWAQDRLRLLSAMVEAAG